MVTDNHFRWDFIGLSTDEKPTPATSSKVVDGSTFYCSDNSKLYVWCKNQWYEKTVSGGGSSYTAGDGINIANDTISVDTTTIQPKLTAGTGISINEENVISAASGSITTLTTDNYNYPSETPDGISLWNLPTGLYKSGYDGYLKLYYGTTFGKSTTIANGQSFLILSRNASGTGSFVYFYDTSYNIPRFIISLSSGTTRDVTIITSNHLADNLTTQSSGSDALDAYQGYVLKGLIDALDARVTALGG